MDTGSHEAACEADLGRCSCLGRAAALGSQAPDLLLITSPVQGGHPEGLGLQEGILSCQSTGNSQILLLEPLEPQFSHFPPLLLTNLLTLPSTFVHMCPQHLSFPEPPVLPALLVLNTGHPLYPALYPPSDAWRDF